MAWRVIWRRGLQGGNHVPTAQDPTSRQGCCSPLGGSDCSPRNNFFFIHTRFKAFKDHMFQEVGVVGVFCWHPRHSSFFQSVKGMIEVLWLVSVQGGKFWNSICTIGSGNILIYRFLWRNKTEGCWRERSVKKLPWIDLRNFIQNKQHRSLQ